MMDLALMLLQQGTTGNPAPIGVFRFFAGFVLIVTIYYHNVAQMVPDCLQRSVVSGLLLLLQCDRVIEKTG